MKSHLWLMVMLATVLPAAPRVAGNQNEESADWGLSPDQTNLLFIIPRNQLGSNLWSRLETEEADASREGGSGTSKQTIYYVYTPTAPKAGSRFEKIFGSDWVVVPVGEEKNMFRLIATHLPEAGKAMPDVRIDPGQLNMKTLTVEPTWPKGSVPRNVLLKWAEIWQSETEATPVVLIMLRF